MDETLKRFLDSIERRSGEEIAALEQKASETRAARMEQLGHEAQQKAERYRDSAMSSVRSAGRRKLAVQQAENRRQLLEFRRKCAEETSRAVLEKIRAYTEDAQYKIALCKLTERALRALGEPDSAVVYLRKEDIAQGAFIAEGLPGRSLRFAEGSFVLGGVIVGAPDRGQRADLSFDTGLTGAQERFGELSGMELS